jgi:membrane-bound serine protease (ClpP class)
MKKFAVFIILLCASTLYMPVFAQEAEDLIPENISVASAPAESSMKKPAWGFTVVALLLGGFLFMFAEIAIIPGFGIAGIIGIIMLVAGLALAFLKLSPGMAIGATLGAGAGLVGLLIWFFYYFPSTSIGKMFVLSEESSVDDGCIAIEDLKQHVGKQGITQTMLRPSGIAVFEDERLDVMSDCEFIEKGVKIKIIGLKGGRLRVIPVEEEN